MVADQPEVYIVDDDPMVRRALGRLIASAGHSVRTFGSAKDLLESGCDFASGCLVLDVRLPDVDGMELYRRLQKSGAALPVIFMTAFGDIPTSVRAIKSGALDFLPKPVGEDVLLRAIDTALQHEASGRAERLQRQELSRRYGSLTPREREVLQLVLSGCLNKQISRRLGISEKTVKVHRGRLMTKMGARRMAQLFQVADVLGLRPAPIEFHPPVAPLKRIWPIKQHALLAESR